MKKILLADYVDKGNDFSFAVSKEKIDFNVRNMGSLKDDIDVQVQQKKKAFVIMADYGELVILYHVNATNPYNPIMYFIDHKSNLDNSLCINIFSDNIRNAAKKLQKEIAYRHNTSSQKIELAYFEPYEQITKDKTYCCFEDNFVLSKAKLLGALPTIENISGGDKVKVSLIDEVIEIQQLKVVNVYAFVRFGGHVDESENGLAYIKIYDLKNNMDRIPSFETALMELGGKFDRAFFMEKFDKRKLN